MQKAGGEAQKAGKDCFGPRSCLGGQSNACGGVRRALLCFALALPLLCPFFFTFAAFAEAVLVLAPTELDTDLTSELF